MPVSKAQRVEVDCFERLGLGIEAHAQADRDHDHGAHRAHNRAMRLAGKDADERQCEDDGRGHRFGGHGSDGFRGALGSPAGPGESGLGQSE